MATVSRTTLTCSVAGVLLIPVTLVILLPGLSTSSAHGISVDDFGDSIRVTFDPSVSCNISSTVDANGDIHMVWEDYRSGNGDIYYVKLDSEGDKLTNDAKISNDSNPSLHPSVAVDSMGHIYIVWENIENDTAELYFAKLWYHAGNITFQANGLRVSDGDLAYSGEPEVAVCADGNLAVVWTDARHDTGNGNLEIFYKRLSTAGVSLTPDIRITGDVGISERPNLDIDQSGMIHVVWYDFRDSDNGLVINHGVFYRKISPDGSALTNETRITFASPRSTPDVAVDTDGNVHVVFDDDRYATFDIFYTLLDNDGNTLVDDRNISPKDDNESRYPRISLSDSRVIDVVWQDQAPGHWAIHYSAITYDGAVEVFDQGLTSEAVGNATGPVVMCAKDNNTLVVYVAEAANEEIFFSRTHRPDARLTATDIALSTSQPLVGSVLWVNATVSNSEGDAVDALRVHLLADGELVDEAFTGSLLAGSSETVCMSHTARASDTTISIILDPYQEVREADETNNGAAVPILVRTLGLDVSPDAWSRSADPGGDAQFTITLSNTGNSAATYAFQNSTMEEGWEVVFGAEGSTIEVDGSASETLAVSVMVPEGVLPGARMFEIGLFDVEKPSVNATLQLMVDVRRVGDVSVTSPSGIVVEPTVPSSCVFVVENSGNSNESFDVVAEDERGWTMSLSQGVVDLAPGVPAEITLTVIPDRYEAPGELNEVTLRLVSKNLTTNVGEGAVLLVAGHHRELRLDLEQQAFVNYSVPEDRQVVYTVGVENLGNSDDTVRMDLAGIDGFWAVLNRTYVFLGPGENGSVRLTMTPGTSVLAGPYSFNVSATSETEPSVGDVLNMGVNVQPFYRLDASPERTAVSPDGGEHLSVNITVTNMGNTVDSADVNPYVGHLNGTILIIEDREYDLVSSLPAPVPLEPGESFVLTLRIAVPDGIAPGEYPVYIEISSINDPTASVSETVTLVVPEKGTWLSVYVIAGIGVAAAVAGMLAFLLLRRRSRREEERVAEERRRAQRRPGTKHGRGKPRPRQTGQKP